MRRQDRAISEQEALDILLTGEYGILSTVSPDGQPYGVPVNFCVIENAIYFHGALEGHKISNISANDKVSFFVVGQTQILPRKFGTKYESTIVTGTSTEVFEQEKHKALVGLIEKYSAEFHTAGMRYITALTEKTRVFKIQMFAYLICYIN